MSTPARQSSQGVLADIERIFALQQAQQWETKSTTAEQRKEKLRKLKSAVEAHGDEIVAAVKQDTRKPENEITRHGTPERHRQHRAEHQQSRRVDEAGRGAPIPEQE